MPIKLTRLADLNALPFDQIIDARSPAEFALDHIPGAINLPSLDNEERAVVGTIYVRESRFRARKVGAAMVARNIATHLEGPLADHDGAWQPLVYCWRGGQRSGAFANYLSQVGWRAETLDGGYRSYRKLVAKLCHDEPFPSKVVLLDGHTGTAKTELLQLLKARGVQVLDLEGAANHRGSAFGARKGGQPSQKQFEGVLAKTIDALDPQRPVILEAESSKVGSCIVPPSVWQAMKGAPRIRITAPVEERAAYLTEAYADLWENPEGLKDGIQALQDLHSAEVITSWRSLTATGQFMAFTEDLMVRHYDPRYGKAKQSVALELHSDSLKPQGLDLLAARIESAINSL